MSRPNKRLKTGSSAPLEITFDPDARQEYLSGFHKRKEARKKRARETAVKKEKEERVVARKQVPTTEKRDALREEDSGC